VGAIALAPGALIGALSRTILENLLHAIVADGFSRIIGRPPGREGLFTLSLRLICYVAAQKLS